MSNVRGAVNQWITELASFIFTLGENTVNTETLRTLQAAGFDAVTDDDIQAIDHLTQHILPSRFREESREIIAKAVAAAANVFNVSLSNACDAIQGGVINHSLTAEEVFPVVVNAGPLYSALGISLSQMLDTAGQVADTGIVNPKLWKAVRERALHTARNGQ